MFRRVPSSNRPRSSALHPRVYGAIIGLAAWLVLSAWGFIGTGNADIDAALTVVTGLVFVSVAIPGLLWLIWRRHRQPGRPDDEDAGPCSLHDWLLGEFDIWQTHTKGTDAVVAILLPLAAVAFGMTIFAIVHRIAIGG